ncbi:NADH-quinone oxidoreductase subunit J family protein [Parapedobacter composti]|nr:NADH-quinone oxidoreductase subunit J [Parapedobacter composti]
MQTIVFYSLAFAAVFSAILLVSLRNIARSLFLFFVVLFAVAGLYLFALADFVAITQVMVYVGGILILMLFAFMLSNREMFRQLQRGTAHFIAIPVWQALPIAILFLTVMLYTALHVGRNEPPWITASREAGTVIRAADNTVEQLGVHTMTHYLLPFEVVSVLLMMALIGAAHLARKEGDA